MRLDDDFLTSHLPSESVHSFYGDELFLRLRTFCLMKSLLYRYIHREFFNNLRRRWQWRKIEILRKSMLICNNRIKSRLIYYNFQW